MLFKSKPQAKAQLSPARAALVAINAELTVARGVVDGCDKRVERFKGIIAAVAPAEAELQDAVAADGGEALASGQIVHMVDTAETARKAATVATIALPKVLAELETAQKAVVAIDAKKRAAINAILIEIGDEIAVRYIEAFAVLAGLRNELEAFASGLAMAGGPDLKMTDDMDIEVPKYNLPSMRRPFVLRDRPGFVGSAHGLIASQGEAYTVRLLARSDRRKIATTALAYSQLAARLATDPAAGFKASTEVAPPQNNRATLQIMTRAKAEEYLPIVDTPKERTMRILASHPG